MKCTKSVMMLIVCSVMQSYGEDFSRYLVLGEKYQLAPKTREKVVQLAQSGEGFESRAMNALLAFELFGKAQEKPNYDFTETTRHAKAAITTSTNDWVNIWAKFTLLGVMNLQPGNTDRCEKIMCAKALLTAIAPESWEVPDNPILKLGENGEKLTVEKMRQLVAGSIIGDYFMCGNFDEAEAFLKTFPDSHWRREAEKQLVLQREQHAFSREEARQIRSREKARRERTP